MSRRALFVTGVTAAVLGGLYAAVCAAFYFVQGAFVYQPSHQPAPGTLAPWRVDGELFGYARETAKPAFVWLVMQGNAGQAGDRTYFKNVPSEQAIYVLEYPGYGQRAGKPSRRNIDAAAASAYRELRRRFPGVPVGVIGESFGSGPAVELTRAAVPPDRVALFVPLARLDLVVGRYIRGLPMRSLLTENWDNVSTLRDYRGPVNIIAADADAVIPREHTLMLAASAPQARVTWIPGGHNAPGDSEAVRLAP